MKTKFTLGPYEAEIHAAGPNLIIDSVGDELARTSGRVSDAENNSEDWYAEDKANAHLLAAAPDMYDALTIAIGYIEATAGAALQHPAIQTIYKALAKARGEI